MSYHREYLLNEFPGYDYNNPNHPWDMHIERPDGARNCGWQMQAFHYYWCEKQCKEDALVGLSFDIPNLPFCLRAPFDWEHPLRLPEASFPLIVASSAIQKVPCSGGGQACRGDDVFVELAMWVDMLSPGGVIVGALMDETYANKHGRSLANSGLEHWWTPNRFENNVLRKITEERKTVQLIEFNTFRNGMSFNFVLRKE